LTEQLGSPTPTHKHTLMPPAYARTRTHTPHTKTGSRSQPATQQFRQTLISPSARCVAAALPKNNAQRMQASKLPTRARLLSSHPQTQHTNMLWQKAQLGPAAAIHHHQQQLLLTAPTTGGHLRSENRTAAAAAGVECWCRWHCLLQVVHCKARHGEAAGKLLNTGPDVCQLGVACSR
jgi:hypothetical protein